MEKVSVIIPAYNSMAYLPETVASVLRQSWTEFELIIVNDGSTDNTEEWVMQLTDARIKLISQQNTGLAGARNTGINHARGEYLAFIDADDLWHPHKLAQQVQVLNENPQVGVVYTWVTYMSEGGKSTGRTVKPQAEGFIWKQLINDNQIECGSVAMVRRGCFERIGLFDRALRSYVEDWDMWLRIAVHYPFKVIPQSLVYYRQRPSSASRNLAAMEQSYQLVLRKAAANAPKDLQSLIDRGYGCAYFCLAWKALQNLQPDYQTAQRLQKMALSKDPQRFLSKENLRLTIAIKLMRWFGNKNYLKILGLMQSVRSRLNSTSAIAN